MSPVGALLPLVGLPPLIARNRPFVGSRLVSSVRVGRNVKFDMDLKRALVVDDSKLARIALKRQLEEHQLAVELADSGEQALEFLKTNMVDVVFMDHEMPGMDGFEAVKAIKSNPLTATIPVMMYTSRGGELYVSQARALGAVDLLPKQTEPGVLFGMLLRLGLVSDRRKASSHSLVGTPAAGESRTQGDERGDEPAGMAISQLLTRILEDQHSELRSDMMRKHRSFAKQVASEIYEQQKADEATSQQQDRGTLLAASWPMLTGALAVGLLSLSIWIFQLNEHRDDLLADVDRLTAVAERHRLSSLAKEEQLTSNLSAEQGRARFAVQQLLGSLAWAMNQSGSVPYDEVPWNAARSEQIGAMLVQLSSIGFQGTLRVESHLGEYCLASDSTGAYVLAAPEAPMATCSFVGHPLDESALLSDRQTPEFTSFMENSPLIDSAGITLELIALRRLDSVPLIPYPIGAATAGEWNAVAARNHRLEYSLLSDNPL